MKKLSFEEWQKLNKQYDEDITIPIHIVKEYALNQYKAYQAYLKESEQPVLPERWEDLKEIKGYWIDSNAQIGSEISEWLPSQSCCKNTFATEAQAKSALAMAQLSQLMKAYNGDWVADWKGKESYYCITRVIDNLAVCLFSSMYFFLSFKSKETAELFLKRFELLIREYYMM